VIGELRDAGTWDARDDADDLAYVEVRGPFDPPPADVERATL
jgi:hypothetical protein